MEYADLTHNFSVVVSSFSSFQNSPDQQYGSGAQMEAPPQQPPPPGTHPAGAGGYSASSGYGAGPPHQGNWGQQG